MENFEFRKNIGRFAIKINFYKKAYPCKFKKGDKVKCKFNNSGHKFWPELKEELIIKRVKFYYPNGYWDLNFENTQNNYFCEYDFEKIN